MTERILPASDIYASCPREGVVLDYYAGVFDAVYVCFNPFIKPTQISTERFCPAMYPSQAELVNLCAPVPWAEVMKLAELPSIAAVDLALRTQIHGIRSERMWETYAHQLEALYDSGAVMPPMEGEHSPFHYESVMAIFKDLGHQWAWFGDEFCTERKLYWIDELSKAESTPIGGHSNIFSADHSLLWTVHWDSHFSFLCGTRTDLERARVAERVEGFYCAPSTEVHWSLRE
ncbi:DUF2711 family protein [Undibacterium cyanobacteriorum]|uniref:DUF2711 family protein n=1 Tax=Undibacterium cyanobacteriorum TaxID=3073561 RepID=A0ABY9RI70_9BURK|nr:DUF2711 family protein [Undibacterium sp. 20NA77.5]WMW80917.1 DUF2711 family protein [Undibacterium sp. 20NA77.5]